MNTVLQVFVAESLFTSLPITGADHRFVAYFRNLMK